MANSDATHMLLVDALLGSDSECDGAANVLNSRWTAWQRDYGTGAMAASQSSGHGPPPQPPDSRLAHAPERAEPPPQPTESRLADAHGRARPAPQQRRARRPRVLALAPSRAPSEPDRVMAHQEEPDTAQCETDECRHLSSPTEKVYRWIHVALAEMGDRHLRHSQTELVG